MLLMWYQGLPQPPQKIVRAAETHGGGADPRKDSLPTFFSSNYGSSQLGSSSSLRNMYSKLKKSKNLANHNCNVTKLTVLMHYYQEEVKVT